MVYLREFPLPSIQRRMHLMLYSASQKMLSMALLMALLKQVMPMAMR